MQNKLELKETIPSLQSPEAWEETSRLIRRRKLKNFAQMLALLLALAAIIFTAVLVQNRSLDTSIFIAVLWSWGAALVIAIQQRQLFLGLYLGVFGVFLLGREAINTIFDLRLDQFSESVDVTTYALLATALAGLIAGAAGHKILRSNKDRRRGARAVPRGKIRNALEGLERKYQFTFHSVFKVAFYLILAGALLARAHAVYFVITNGYYSFYSEYFALRASNPILYLLWKIELSLPFAFALVFGTWNKTKPFPKWVLVGYLVYLALNIFSGQRFATVAGGIVILAILIRTYGQEIISFIRRRWILSALILVAFFLAGISALSAMEWLRGTEDGTFQNVFANFVYTQGVSILTIKRTVYYLPLLPADKYYSLSSFFYGIPGALMGLKTYQGSSVTTAFMGNSLSHAITYTTAPSFYLRGGSLGSSYIAEAYHDFGFVGVLVWSVLIGIVVSWIGSKKKSQAGEIIRLAIIPAILWTPRGEASAFIERIIQPSNLIPLTGTAILIGLIVWHRKSTNTVAESAEEVKRRQSRRAMRMRYLSSHFSLDIDNN